MNNNYNFTQIRLLALVLLFLGWSWDGKTQSWNQAIKVVASDRSTEDIFGWSVSISSDYAIVGSPSEDEDISGGNTVSMAGSAYILKNNAGTWTQVQKIVASDRGALDQFGHSVSISGDYVIVGALDESEDVSGSNTRTNAGSAYIFKNDTGTWVQMQKIVASDRAAFDQFGFSVSISGDYAIVGARWEDQDVSGGNTLDAAGSAYIFKNNAGTWTQVQKIVASDRASFDWFGGSVDISGDYAIVGANLEDENTTGGNTFTSAGSVYVFKNNMGNWTQTQKIVASNRGTNHSFGVSVSISGDYAIVGSSGEDSFGTAYIFKNNSGTWNEEQKIVATDRASSDQFGFSVAISGDYAIVGARFEEEDASGSNTVTDAGSAYIFKNDAGTWMEVEKIVAADRGVDDEFGSSVGISGDYAIVGVRFEDENASGGNTLTDAGSVYVFERNDSGGGGGNNAPTVANPIPNQNLSEGFTSTIIDLTNTFVDVDNDGLMYSASSDATGVVTVAVSSNTLTITEVGTGTATITVTADDGKGGTVNDVFVVNVNAAGNNAPIVSNPIPDQNLNQGFASSTIDLTNVFSDTDALTYTATSDNTAVATASVNASTLIITEVGNGTANITVTANDGKGGTVEDTFEVTISASGGGDPDPVVASLEDLESEVLSLYPNPTEDVLTVEGFTGKVNFTVSDTQGQVVLSRKGEDTFEVDLSALPAGIYTLSLENKGNTVSKKVVKQ